MTSSKAMTHSRSRILAGVACLSVVAFAVPVLAQPAPSETAQATATVDAGQPTSTAQQGSAAPSQTAPPPPATTAAAQPSAAQPTASAAQSSAAPPAQVAPAVKTDAAPEAKVTPLGYVETAYSWNFNEPSNGITNYRGYDNRHNTFTLQNVAAGATLDYASVTAKVVLQVGQTPSTYYLGEPVSPGAGGAAASDGDLWKYVQEANLGWKAPIGNGLLLQAGLFLSPIGAEGIAAKDNWNWSRSDVFFALPAYHTGVRASYDFGNGLVATLAGYNGWNSVVDNNDEKSVSTSVDYKKGIFTGHLLYFGGVERSTGAPEGPYWRSDFDGYAQLDFNSRFSMLLHANSGFEPNRFGTSSWAAGALYARVKIADWLYLAARGDAFYESVPTGASAILWPTDWVSSATATIDVRPTPDHLSIRLEYRHDHADGDMFFRGQVTGDGVTTPYVPNTTSQDTLTLGATAWF